MTGPTDPCCRTDGATELISMETLERVAPLLRNVAHPVRLRVLDVLQHGGERTVSDLVKAAGCSQALMSQQLRILKDQGVLISRREGTKVYYDIVDRGILLLLECIRRHQ